MATQTLNFIMTGSIAGGRGLEALLVLKQLPHATPNFGRCVVVVWSDEANGDIFEEIKACPVELLVLDAPPRTSFGFMERQYKALLAALPYFADHDILVKIRTDYNYLLRPILTYLDKIIAAGNDVPTVLRGRIVCGEISILHPGRIHDFNFAATKGALRIINWCESFFTADYGPIEMEPEFRWFGMHFATSDPLFFHCYENRDMRALMRGFFNKYRINDQINPATLPPIIKYMNWRIASLAFDQFLCAIHLGARNMDPAIVYNAQRADVSVYHDNIPDLRITSHLCLADIAGIGPIPPLWQPFIEEAISVAEREKKTPGTTIELFEREFGAIPTAQKTYRSGQRIESHSPNGEPSVLSAALEALSQKSAHHFPSFRDFPSDILFALRKESLALSQTLAAHIMRSDNLHGQMANRYAAFCITIFCALVDHKDEGTANRLFTFLCGETPAEALESLTSIIANRSKKFAKSGYTSTPSPYHLPQNASDHDMLLDYYTRLCKLIEHAVDIDISVAEIAKAAVLQHLAHHNEA